MKQITISVRELERGLSLAVYPGLCGSSGTVCLHLSGCALRLLAVTSMIFLGVLVNNKNATDSHSLYS